MTLFLLFLGASVFSSIFVLAAGILSARSNRREDYVETVSYTHLDVYKRQVVTGALYMRGGIVGSGSAAPMFAALGLVAWFIGLRFYGLRGLALRGGRPLFAGIGFAVLGWVAVLIGRFLPGLPRTTFNPCLLYTSRCV